MKDVLGELGLNEKEAKFYLFLLENGNKTAAEISKELKETRTNAYMILNKLIDEGLISTDDSTKVQRFFANSPEKLKNLLVSQQQQIRQNQIALNRALPELTSLYSLGTHKPGVVYLEGLKGFKALLEDMYRSGQPSSLLASDVVPQNEEAWVLLERETKKRGAKEIPTRAIFHEQAREWLNKKTFGAKGFDVKFWGDKPLEGEVVIYGEKIAFTVYKPALIVTVITNKVLADTFLTIFDQLWSISER